jgi:hypothetical protein
MQLKEAEVWFFFAIKRVAPAWFGIGYLKNHYNWEGTFFIKELG